MILTKEQIQKYIQIHKEITGIELPEEDAIKSASNLLLFFQTIVNYNANFIKSNGEKTNINNNNEKS